MILKSLKTCGVMMVGCCSTTCWATLINSFKNRTGTSGRWLNCSTWRFQIWSHRRTGLASGFLWLQSSRHLHSAEGSELTLESDAVPPQASRSQTFCINLCPRPLHTLVSATPPIFSYHQWLYRVTALNYLQWNWKHADGTTKPRPFPKWSFYIYTNLVLV